MAEQEAITFPEKDHLRHSAGMNHVVDSAKSATKKEHDMTLLPGIRLYPQAVAWSLLISTCIAMEGYDVCLLGSFYGFPQFNKKYGVLVDPTCTGSASPTKSGSGVKTIRPSTIS